MNTKAKDRIATGVFYAMAMIIVAVLFGLLFYILFHGLQRIDLQFITSSPEFMKAGGGVGPQLFNSLYLLVLTMLITLPLGLGGGIYLAEYAPKNKVTDVIRLSIEVLSSLPSIVVGLFGLMLFVNTMGWGYSILSGAFALTVFNLPLMVRVVEESLSSVPREQKEASFALGITHWATIRKVLLPVALPGILTGAILAAGRIFGEAAALLFTAGMSSPNLNFANWNLLDPASPLNPFRPAETLAVHIWKINSEGLIPDVREVADGASALLVITVLVFNIAARWFGKWLYRRLTAS
ncbi:phosphate ABC transporter permease PstA [Ammoniphilus resinae]|uniref:Phosphate transport system permease protein PstA n=1 Tax=Ammoniphilus resinae TaxID=861532 RepID=A0ABS4GS70_9BACL|nr:phosphate ABC transporter permease PstA [Ammoniphilus resinae]MBP1933096.1 phosphate transport system permease protein [Ammoniphilus resinae]